MKYTVHFVYVKDSGDREDAPSEWDVEKDGRPSDAGLERVVQRLVERFPLNTSALRYAFIESKEKGEVARWYRDQEARTEAFVFGTRFDDREVV